MQNEREKIGRLVDKLGWPRERNDIIDLILQEKSQSYAEGKKQGVIETVDKILLDLTIADIGTPPKISNVDDRIKTRQYLSNLKLHAEQSLGEGK